MRLLFLALSQHGYGETVIGMSLARQLIPLGVESHFVVEATAEPVVCHGGFGYTVLSESMGPLAGRALDDVVAEFKPDALVLADYLMFSRAMRSVFLLDPWYIDRYRLPVLPIDIWGLDGRDLEMDFGGQETIQLDPRIRQLTGHLRPVPLTHPQPAGDGRLFPFRLSDADGRVSRRTRGHLHTTLGIPRGHRLAMITFAGWQHSPDPRYDERFHRIARRVPELLAHYLRALPPTTHFMVIGGLPGAFRALPADRLITLPSCAPKRFAVLTGAADLIISLNAASTAVAEAILADVPAVVLSNRFTVTGAAPGAEGDPETPEGPEKMSEFVQTWLAGTGPLYPFRIWPLGYHRFLEPLLAGNPYAGTLATAELLDEDGVMTVLEAALYDRATRDAYARARAGYHRTVAALPGTCEAFTRAAQAAGLTVR
jgi:Family of unknown function (DUF6365)